jgi:shikimate kinase
VLRPENRAALRSAQARVVWLSAEPRLLVDRVSGGGHRPLLDDDPQGTLQRMYDERAVLYRGVADAIVLVDGRSVSEVVDAVLR